VGQLKKRKPQKSRQKGASPQINRSALRHTCGNKPHRKTIGAPLAQPIHRAIFRQCLRQITGPHPFPVYLPSAKLALPWPRTDATLCPFFLALCHFEHHVHSCHGTEITSRAKGVTLWNGPEGAPWAISKGYADSMNVDTDGECGWTRTMVT
jgi:hypothetical protein